ncbi:MAG TPA: capsule assembly Wzi family protein [Gemmatimonadaceae bacterium]
MTRPFFDARTWLAAIALLAATATHALAQGTTVVPPDDIAYLDIERLAELGALDSLILGQRPYSRREFGRILRVARTRLDRVDRYATVGTLSDEEAYEAGAIVQRLAARFSEETEEQAFDRPMLALLDGVSLTFTSTDAIRRGFPASYSKPVEATIDPLAQRRLGDPAVRGQTTALELSHRLELFSWLSLHSRERLEYRAPRNDTTISKTRGELLLAAMRARFGNVALDVGREQFAWGQEAGDGLFLASDAPALDQISVASDHPFVLPIVGLTQGTIILANLGPSTVRSYSKLLAYKVSVRPTSSLEIGGSFLNHFGGQGGRPSSLGNRIVDFLPFVDIFRRHNYTDTTHTLDVDSDKLLGMDARLRLDQLYGITVSGEVLIDDFDVHRLRYLFTEEGSSNISITVPSLGTPEWSLRVAAKHMGPITYTHGALTNGITTRGRLLGDELGPDAKEFGGELRWIPVPSVRLMVEGWSTQYSNNEYASFYSDSAHTQFQVVKVASSPNEQRDRFLATLIVQGDEGLAFVLRGGGERIRNADFLGDRRRSYVVDVALRLRQ